MTEYLNKVSSKEKSWMDVGDTEENIISDLREHALDPIFELYGGFVNRCPEWLNSETADKYIGCTVISGTFLTLSHAFRLVTDDEALIGRLAAAIRENQQREDYKAARKKALAKVPVLTDISKAADIKPGKYMFKGFREDGEIIKITRVYRITEEEANEQSLLYLDHWEGRNSEGILIGGAFRDGDKLQTTSGWAIYQKGEEK